MKISKQTIYFLGGITLLWIILAVIINPIGNFPIIDDLAYGKQVKILLETGKMTMSDWSSMTLIAHIYIGAFVCWIFGYSYTVLRILTLCIGLLGVFSTYFLLNEFSIKKVYSFLGAFLVGFHPYYYSHCWAFMTDVPFYTFSIITLLFYVKYYKNEKTIFLLLGIIFNITTLLIRDLAIWFPIAFGLCYIYRNGIKLKSIYKIILPTVLAIITYLIWKYWTIHSLGNPKGLSYIHDEIFKIWTKKNVLDIIYYYIRKTFFLTIFFGVYCAPIIVLSFFSKYSTYSKKSLKKLLILIMIFIAIFIIFLKQFIDSYSALFFLLSNHIILHNYYFSNIYLPDYYFYRFFPKELLIALSILGITTGITLWYIFIQKYINYKESFNNKMFTKRKGTNEFIILNLFFYICSLLSFVVFGRYLYLPIALIFILLFTSEEFYFKKPIIKYFIISIFTLFYFYNSISAAHDLIEFNRNRFTALTYLDTELKIDRKLIDGGFEYNAYYFFDFEYKKQKNKNWWWVQDDKYMVLWEKVQNYHVIKDYTWNRWFFPCNTEHTYILERNE